ncbi:hypothetical protein PZT57_27025 [Pseudomonas aeruginosa]|uniref:DUF7688 family protein n=1 Tax=Pseudomonas aeruginosa TaxID=287 RepID=UPI002B26B2E5|nr:hypothetical protein [Pseudomonas aeruginosa]MEA8592305.1 hypothetical protein [Pseudomonas aeruginosa]
MTNAAAATMTHEIKIDGEFLIRGDSASIGVIWYNLTGRNFSDRLPVNPELTYENYLQMVEHDWQCELKTGGLTFHPVGSAKVLKTHTIQR